ncbi:MAG TPA: DUF423 domain-containing protein [Stenotrophomonas sp.]|jgi:uncharacterized membrane protein YgdD (TMEM256/DUF423 family)|uniref:DUF423 domain-containing protein n=1 Tax=Stenotrophomonas maltophilia TaxID=40324 RepID=A0A4V3RIM7_STEMA|nr:MULTISPECIES: DUF423 domain-containing protein [Stenotrophomonas]QIO87382.1 membrane protein [Stenotrophomonas rhizophila]TGY32720.1 DUF423 domain-containing protein [Stenotrophomonas maltophilia]HBS63441.1 DUF423 domain-containing protein [Stenotrophomonas sp.]
MLNLERRARRPSLLACLGGLLAAAAVGLSAYASHGIAEPLAQSHVNTAALFAFGHGVALAALGATQQNRVGKLALSVLLLGTLLFSGSLVAGAVWQFRTGLAPVGGSALMLGWVVYAFNALRR